MLKKEEYNNEQIYAEIFKIKVQRVVEDRLIFRKLMKIPRRPYFRKRNSFSVLV